MLVYITSKNIKIYQDWELWSTYKSMQILNETKFQKQGEKVYKSYAKLLNLPDTKFSNQAYSWLARVENLKNYSFKEVSKQIDKDMYKNYTRLSGYIHNDDYLTKTLNFFDMHKLIGSLYDAYFYTDKIIELYDKRYLKDNRYNILVCDLLDILNKNLASNDI